MKRPKTFRFLLSNQKVVQNHRRCHAWRGNMFLRNNSNENWFVSSERPRKSTLVLFPRRTESSLAEAVYARRKIVCISHIVLRGKTKIALALHRQETTVQQSWDNEHVETELDKKKIIFFFVERFIFDKTKRTKYLQLEYLIIGLWI